MAMLMFGLASASPAQAIVPPLNDTYAVVGTCTVSDIYGALRVGTSRGPGGSLTGAVPLAQAGYSTWTKIGKLSVCLEATTKYIRTLVNFTPNPGWKVWDGWLVTWMNTCAGASVTPLKYAPNIVNASTSYTMVLYSDAVARGASYVAAAAVPQPMTVYDLSGHLYTAHDSAHPKWQSRQTQCHT
jgi:hypothetical protein